jgi:hypothetical protein
MRGLILVFVLLLTGCASKGTLPASVLGGECRVFEKPRYEVRGDKPYDQDWIDSTVESGVGGCGWDRPEPRPPEFDAPRGTAKAKAPPLKKASLGARVKAKVKNIIHRRPDPKPDEVWPKQPQMPITPTPVAPTPKARPAPPRDDLLDP